MQNSYEEISQNVIMTDEGFINYFKRMRITVLEREIENAIQLKFQLHCSVQLDCAYDTQYAEVLVRSVTIYGVEENAMQSAIRAYLAQNGYNEVNFG